MSEYLVIRGDQVYKCPIARRRVEGDNYIKDVLTDITADYWQYIRRGASTKQHDVITAEGAHLQAPPPIPREYVPRKRYLRREDFVKYGFTSGCPE